MANNTNNNRIPVKWVRDKAKAAYVKQENCYICGSMHDLELHHLISITVLLNKWSKDMGYDISTDDGILAVRDEFIDTHHKELYEDVFTLCNKHHVALHSVYGKAPAPTSTERQRAGLEKQKAKAEGRLIETEKHPSLSFFSEFT